MELKLRENSLFKRPWLMVSLFVSFVSMVAMMIGFNYTDGSMNLSWSIELLDCIFRKTDMEFYDYSATCVRREFLTYWSCDKSILVMLPLSIWNLPVWIVHEITGEMYVTGVWNVVWMKFGFILAIVVTSIESMKIVKLVRPDADRMLVFPLIFGSFDVLCSTMYAGQDEVIYIMFLALALRFMMESKRKRFLLFAALAVSLNPEMLIPVLLIILFYEKRLQFVILDLLITVIPFETFNLLYRNNETYNKFNWLNEASDSMKSLFGSDIALSQSDGNVSLFLVVLCVLVFFTFAKRKDDSKPVDILWIVAVSMVAMTLLSSGSFLNHFYRSILYVPFLVMLIVASEQNIRTNTLLYGLYSVVRGWMCLFQTYPQNMASSSYSFPNEFTNMVMEKTGRLVLGPYLAERMPILGNYGLFTAAAVALAIVIFYINYRPNQTKSYVVYKFNQDITVFAISLFTPFLLGSFAYMILTSNYLDKELLFGTCYIDYYETANNELSYYEYDGISYYNHQIVYEDNAYVQNGYDVDGVRFLDQNGVSFGPYLALFPGDYRITISGSDLSDVSYDCTRNAEGEIVNLPLDEEERTETSIVYVLHVGEFSDNIELRIFNWSEETIAIYSVKLQEVK